MQDFMTWYEQHQHLAFGEARDCYEDYKRVHRPLELHELIAVQAFAAEYGRDWKEYLKAAWLSYTYKGKRMGGQDTGTLRMIRNHRGHDWLDEYQLPGKAVNVPARGQRVQVATEFGNGPIRMVTVLGTGEKNGKPLIDYEDDNGNRRWAYVEQLVKAEG
jgi:hypothetical protein